MGITQLGRLSQFFSPQIFIQISCYLLAGRGLKAYIITTGLVEYIDKKLTHLFLIRSGT
jgi:hypothetical protein